jgi:hypothetical protein
VRVWNSGLSCVFSLTNLCQTNLIVQITAVEGPAILTATTKWDDADFSSVMTCFDSATDMKPFPALELGTFAVVQPLQKLVVPGV